ncbi:MAG TPA: FAD-binding oxidoreductase, partial [Dehalococcoidia bacterium]
MLSDALVEELRGMVGRDQVHIGPAQLIAYSLDGTFAQNPPDVALTPESTDQVAAIMRFAARESMSVLP